MPSLARRQETHPIDLPHLGDIDSRVKELGMLGRLALLSILIPAAGFFVSPVTAQVATGNIRGTVLDASEAVIPNAVVVLTNISTGFTRSVTCNERGDFDAPSMPLGDYQIAASAGGFQKKI